MSEKEINCKFVYKDYKFCGLRSVLDRYQHRSPFDS